MIETTNRQAYVFLQDGDTLISGDLYFLDGRFETAFGSHGCKIVKGNIALRPITLPTEQTDKLMIEQLKKENNRMRDMLESVVNELSLSDESINEHGQHGTDVSKLVRLVLSEKNLQLKLIGNGFKDAQPAEQPSETCKWRWGKIGGRINPHFTNVVEWSETFTYCPTCGKKIEVVE